MSTKTKRILWMVGAIFGFIALAAAMIRANKAVQADTTKTLSFGSAVSGEVKSVLSFA